VRCYGNATPHYGNATPHYGNATPHYGNVARCYDIAAPHYGNAAPRYGNAAPRYGNAAPRYGHTNGLVILCFSLFTLFSFFQMANIYFLPGGDDERNTWLDNFAAKLPLYGAKYGISAADMQAVQNGHAWWAAILTYQSQFMSYGNTITAFKAALRNGLEAGATLSPLTVPSPTLPDTKPQPGIFALVSSLANTIKNSPDYSVADGNDLGIEGTPQAKPDPSTLVPDLSVVRGSGGHPELKWHKQNMPMLDICVDRSQGKGWEKLDTSDQNRYTDTHELPPAGSAAVWRYKAIYKHKGAQVGQWCEPVPVSVMGGV